MKLLQIALLLASLLLLVACENECVGIFGVHQNGRPEFVRNYPECEDTSTYYYRYYFDNRQMGTEGFVKNSKQEGEWKSWNNKGVQTEQWDVKEGKTNGLAKCWHDNGVLSREGYFNNGIENGIETIWYENGKLASYGNYANGKKEGIWKYFGKSDRIKIVTYKSDVKSGAIYYRGAGSTGVFEIVVGQYANDEKTGIWKWFDEDSTETEIISY